MRNKISGLFKLSASLSTAARRQVLDNIQKLPVQEQEKIADYTIQTMIGGLRRLMKSGFELQKRQPPKYVEAAKTFQKASQLADSLLNISETIGSSVEKTELSEVYAQFASSLKSHAPHLASKEEMVKKALSLDPNNFIANELKVDMDLDEYINEHNSSF